jgi:hypothetical protein
MPPLNALGDLGGGGMLLAFGVAPRCMSASGQVVAR